MMSVRRITARLMFCCILLGVIGSTRVYANSAQTIWSGVTSSGVIVEEENCPLIVEKEVLTFDIPQFPSNYYQSIEAFTQYNATVTAEYTFYNPSDYTVTATLAFPFGNMPDYGVILDQEGEIWTHETAEHTRQYGVQINGEPIDSVLRHTYAHPYDDFDLERDLPKLRDGFTEDPFFTPDMTVTTYTYEVSNITEEEGYASFRIAENEDIRRIYPDEFNGFDRDGKQLSYGFWIKNGETITLTVVGEPFSDEISWMIYKTGAEKEQVQGDIVLINTERMTFRDFALNEYDPSGGILESDWYNAFVDERNKDPYRLEFGMRLSYSLMRWYEYEITLAPGERIVNAVTAPIYPGINAGYEPPVYHYTYLLSPAQTWSEFGSLDIAIETPYYLISHNQQNFEKTSTGYRMRMDGLPEGELAFTMCAEENPKKESPNISGYLSMLLMLLMFFVILAVPLVVVSLTVIWFIRTAAKHIKKKEKT